MDAGSGRSNLVHAGYQNRSSVIAQKVRLQTTTTETGIHPEEKRQDETARDSDDKGPRDEGAPSARAGTNLDMNAGPKLLWIPKEPLSTGCVYYMQYPLQTHT